MMSTTIQNLGDKIKDDLRLEGGNDTVHTTVSLSLVSTFVENAIIEGTSGVKVTGGSEANRITSGDGNDTLDGGIGADILIGGAGNDIFYIDDRGDLGLGNLLAEKAGGGDDTAIISVKNFDARKLENIEHHTTVGEGSINNVASAPVAVETGTYFLAVLENQQGNYNVAKIKSNDDGNGGALEYHLVNDFGGTFQINATTGVITAVKKINYETNPFFDLQVYAQESDIANGGLTSDVSTIRIDVRDVNEKPLGVAYTSAQIAERRPGRADFESSLRIGSRCSGGVPSVRLRVRRQQQPGHHLGPVCD